MLHVLPRVLQERAAYRIDRVTDNLVALIQHLLGEAGQKQVGSPPSWRRRW
jgi:hypothetical protein